MKYLIIGAGGTGGAIGAHMARAGKDVTFIVRGRHLDAMKQDGLRVIKPEEAFTIQNVSAYTMEEYDDIPDVILVCVKGYSVNDTIPFIRRIAGKDTIVIPILNLYGTGEMMQRHLPDLTVTDGCIYVASEIAEPGVIRMRGNILRVFFGMRDRQVKGSLQTILKCIETDLNDSGILGMLSENIKNDALLKFSYVSPHSACGVYYDVPADAMQKPGEIRECFIQLIREINVLANAMGIFFDEDIVKRNLRILDSVSPEMTTSLQKDLANGSVSEIDGQIYEVVRMAEQHQVTLPVYEKIVTALRERRNERMDRYYCKKTGFSVSGFFYDPEDMVSKLKQMLAEEDVVYYFRGQVSPWPLRSSLHRSKDIDHDLEETYRFTEWLRKNRYVCDENGEADRNMLLTVAQHYGYKTDFIDFTTDLEVAAFFATDLASSGVSPEEIKGCLWCVSPYDIRALQEFFQYCVKTGVITDVEVIRLFEENQTAPFFHYDFPGLSRIKNQSGLFLWDYKGLFTDWYFDGPDCRFEHMPSEAYAGSRINRNFIYPEPNVLEREIERYRYPETAAKTQASDEYRTLTKNFQVCDIQPFPHQYPGLAKIAEGIPWQDEAWMKSSKAYVPNEQINDYKEYRVTSLDKQHCNEMIRSFYEAYEKRCILEFVHDVGLIKYVLNDVVRTLTAYPYRQDQISDCLYYTMQYILRALLHPTAAGFVHACVGRRQEEHVLSQLPNHVRTEKLAREIYGDEVLEVEMSDEMNVMTRFFVPMTFLDKEIFDFADICVMFARYALPYQFAFRSRAGRIYIPCFVRRIGPA